MRAGYRVSAFLHDKVLVDVAADADHRAEAERISSIMRVGMDGAARRMAYMLAATTGLRLGELKALHVRDVDLDAMTVTVHAATAKNRREDTLPLRANVAEELRQRTVGKHSEAALLPFPAVDRGSDMVKADCEDAGIGVEDAAGRTVDFHALRHTFISLLAAGRFGGASQIGARLGAAFGHQSYDEPLLAHGVG